MKYILVLIVGLQGCTTLSDISCNPTIGYTGYMPDINTIDPAMIQTGVSCKISIQGM